MVASRNRCQEFNPQQIIVNFLLLLGVIAVVSVPWQLYIFNAFPQEANWESSFNFKHLTDALEDHGHPFYYHLDKVRVLYGELIYLPLIWFFYKAFKNPRNRKRLVIAAWILIPFIFFSIAKTKMQAYTLFTAPALFIVTALFWNYLSVYRNRFKPKWLVVLVLFLLIALPIRYSIERIKPFAISDRNPQWTKEIRELKNHITNEKHTIIFNSEHPIETMFYTDYIAYSMIPDSLTLTSLNEQGYTLFIRSELDKDFTENDTKKNDIILPEYKTRYSRVMIVE